MGKILSSTGVMPPDCCICNYNNASFEFEREGDDSFFICDVCAKVLLNHLQGHYPEAIDIPYIWYLRTSKEMDKNYESNKIKTIIEEGLKQLDKYPNPLNQNIDKSSEESK